MRVKIKIPPNHGSWPSQFQGKTVEVKVQKILFEDGTEWHTNAPGYDVEIVVESEDAGGSLLAAIGYRPARIVIEG